MKYEVTVDRIKEEEYCLIPELYANSFAEEAWSYDWHKFTGFSSETTWLARNNNKLSGFLVSYLKSGRPYISVVGVIEKYHYKGIGSALIRHSNSYWRTKEYKSIGVHVLKDNKTTKVFYEKIGFDVEEETEEDYFMTCEL